MIISIPTIISACGVVVTAAYAINKNSLMRSKVRKELERKRVAYLTASAGTPSHAIPAKQNSISTRYTLFRDSNGKNINADDYLQFVVKGDSMQFCGIHNNDIIFVRKGFQLKDLNSFPIPVVIRRENAPSDETQYKIRRAWGVCAIDTCEELVNSIVSSKKFQNIIMTIKYFDSHNDLLNDFHVKRLANYRNQYLNSETSSERYKQVIISTTFHTDESKIRFSIHPIIDVVGIVSESFTI